MSARQAIALVARREIRERLRSRVFLVSTVVLLLVVGGSTALGGALARTPTYRVAVAAPAPHGLAAALRRTAQPFDAKVALAVVPSAAAARQQLRAGRADAVLFLAADRIAFRSRVDARLAAIADTAVRALRRHLPPAPELTAVTVEPPQRASSDAEVLTAMLGACLLLGALAVYGQWVLTGVVEEKANRVVEVVLAAIRPRHLLAGKVLGIGLLGLAQVALVGGLAAVLLAAGVFDAPASLGGSVALVIPWFALGYALYAVAYATAGAVASRAQDASSAGTPVTYTLLAVFLAGYATLTIDDEGRLAQILTVFPLSAPLVLPARAALTGVPVWQHALAVALTLATIYALVRLAGRVYGEGLLQRGGRLELRLTRAGIAATVCLALAASLALAPAARAKSAPLAVRSARTADVDRDGHLDRIVLTFSRPASAALVRALHVRVAGHEAGRPQKHGTAVIVPLREPARFDTGARPRLSISAPGLGLRTRTAGDGAPPVVTAVSSPAAGTITISWSEPVGKPGSGLGGVSVVLADGSTQRAKATLTGSSTETVSFSQHAAIARVEVAAGSLPADASGNRLRGPLSIPASSIRTGPVPAPPGSTPAPPGPVLNLRVSGTGVPTATIAWQAPAGAAAPLSYTVAVSYGGRAATTTSTTETTVTLALPEACIDNVKATVEVTAVDALSRRSAPVALEVMPACGGGGGGATPPPAPALPAPSLPAPTPGSPKPAASVMFNCTDAPSRERAPVYDLLHDAGVSWVRINFPWLILQPDDPQTTDADRVASLDECVQLARDRGIHVLIDFFAAPPWAVAPDAGWNGVPLDMQQFGDALAFLVKRYQGQVEAWEIGNEENASEFWAGTVQEFVLELQVGYRTVKAIDPSGLVVFGGTAYNDDSFVQEAYSAGAKGFFDVLATHPYPSVVSECPETPDSGEGSFAHVVAVHDVMVAHGDGAKPIWFTESGWSAPFAVTEEQQADYLTRMLNYTRVELPYVTNVFWFEAKNEIPSITPESWQGGLSLIAPDLTPRPALAALARWIAAP